MAEEIKFGSEFDSNGEFSLIDDGDYEVALEKVEKRVSKNGKNYLNITFKIRDDVKGQKFGKRKLFYSVTQKEGDPCYDFSRINKIIITQKGLKTYNDHFIDFDEVLQYLVGLHLILTVETVFNDYSGEDKNQIKDWSFRPSEWDKTEHPVESTETKSANLEGITIPDNDLPF